MKLALTVAVVFALLVICETWWRKRHSHDEFSRKFIHLTVGSLVAFWPFYLSWHEIYLLSLAFIVVVGLSRALGVFQAIHSVQRPTLGEFFFAAAVVAVGLVTHNKWIYAASILQMSLSDGLAAVIGTRFGGAQKYTVMGHTKSLVGSLTFAVTAAAILVVFNSHLPHALSLWLIGGLSVAGSILENLSILGADNLVIPVVFALVLTNT
jgi:phytol kinase